MKAPKKGYSYGGPITPKKMSAQEWYDYNIKQGYDLAAHPSDEDLKKQLAMGKYFTFFDPNKYKRDFNTNEFINIENPKLKHGDKGYDPFIDYNYVAPAEPVKPQPKARPFVDPNHKPLIIGPYGTVDPNTGTTYKEANKSETITPQVIEAGHANGGLVKKTKGYAVGGSTGAGGVGKASAPSSNPSQIGGGADMTDLYGGLTDVASQGALLGAGAIAAKNQADENGMINVKKSEAAGALTGGATGLKMGATIGLNPLALAATGGLSALAIPAAGLIGGGIGAITAKNKAEKQNVAAQQVLDQKAKLVEQAKRNLSIGQANSQRALENYKDGGKIEGKGTAKSDSIKAKVKENSFVVPAENAKVAEVIREKVLKAPATKKANLKQKGGEEVKLSNGEHLFSPEEVEKIERELGDDVLDKLAPNSAANEDKLEGENPKMAAGGRLSAEKARIMLHDGTIHGKPITEQQRKYFGWVASGRKGYADGGEINDINEKNNSENSLAYPKEIENKFETLRKKTEDDLKAKFPNKDVKVVYNGQSRGLKEQNESYKKGASTTKFGLHGVGGARDFNIIIDGRILGNTKEDRNIYQNYLWKNAENQGLFHLKTGKGNFGDTDPYHIGLVEETGDGTAFKRLIEAYPQLTKTKIFNDTLKEVQNLKSKNPSDTTYDKFLNNVLDKNLSNPLNQKKQIVAPKVTQKNANTAPVEKTGVNTANERNKIESERLALELAKKEAEAKKQKDAEKNKIANSLLERQQKAKSTKESIDKAQKEYDALQKSYNDYDTQTKAAMSAPKSSVEKWVGTSSRPDPEAVRLRKEELLSKIEAKKSELDGYKSDYAKAINDKSYLPKTISAPKIAPKPLPAPSKDTIDPLNTEKPAIVPQETAAPTPVVPKQGLAATTAPKPSYATFNPNEYAAREDANLTAPTADSAQMTKAESSTLAPPPTATTQGEMGIAEGAGTPPPPSAKADLGKALTSGLSTLTQYGIPLAQTAIGLSYLNKAGKRPIDKIDPDYLQGIGTARGIVDRANAQAKYGFSPEEMAMINQQNQAETNAQRFAARNLSGGSAANALTNERSAINDSFARGLAAKTQNRNLQLAKQQYADTKQSELNSLLADKANRSRALFGDTLNAWQQSQAAGAGLVGAGLQNLTSADRYRQELEAARLRNEKYGN